jgi:hypothetical protein
VGKSLSASESRIRRSYRSSRGEHRTISVEHDEGCVLIGQPTKRGERNHAIRSDHDKTPEPMPNTWEAMPEAAADSIFQRQMTTLDAHPDPVTE